MGSEMCIRDRSVSQAGRIHHASLAGSSLFGAGKVGDLIAGGRSVCLLYTSDAADERSSVDLGGRRILKKKNKEVVNRLRVVISTK